MALKSLFEQEVFDSLRAARDGGQPWFVKAGLLQAALDRAPDDSAAARIRSVASDATKLSAGVLRRYVSLLGRLREIAEAENVEAQSITSQGFNASEIAVRIHDRNPDEGMRALLELKAGETTLIELRDRLASVPVWTPEPAEVVDASRRKRASALRAAAVFERIAVRTAFMSQAVERSALVPSNGRLRKRRSTPLFSSREGSVEIVTESSDRMSVTLHGGAELMGFEPETGDDVRDFARQFPSIVLLSSFYPRFHLCFSSRTPPSFVDAAQRAIDLFGTHWIGVAFVTAGGDVEVVLAPRGLPVPDRTDRYSTLFPPRRNFPSPNFAALPDGAEG